MPLSKACTTVGFSVTGHCDGWVVISIREANDVSVSGRSFRLFRFAGKFDVSFESRVCCAGSVNQRKKAIASALLGDASFTIKELPAPPQMRIGYLDE